MDCVSARLHQRLCIRLFTDQRRPHCQSRRIFRSNRTVSALKGCKAMIHWEQNTRPRVYSCRYSKGITSERSRQRARFSHEERVSRQGSVRLPTTEIIVASSKGRQHVTGRPQHPDTQRKETENVPSNKCQAQKLFPLRLFNQF